MKAKIEKPEPIKYMIPTGNEIVINDPKDVVVEKGNRCLDGGMITINGTRHPIYVTIDNKPALKAEVDQWLRDWSEYEAATAAEFIRNVPGYDTLKDAQDAAYNEEQRYNYQMIAMLESGRSISIKPLDKTLREKANQLEKQYPRAALYLKSEGYMLSNNVDKYSAGHKAKDLIAGGGNPEDAKRILDNWVPEDAKWN